MGVRHSAISHPRRSQFFETLTLEGPGLTKKFTRLVHDGKFRVVEDIIYRRRPIGALLGPPRGSSLQRLGHPDCGSLLEILEPAKTSGKKAAEKVPIHGIPWRGWR